MNYRVLIVDDSPLLRATARRAVLQAGVADENIREAHDGQQALEALASGPVDVVLLDVNMPVMDGYEFLEKKAANPLLAGVKVALVTTEVNEQRLRGVTSLGVLHYLRKPFEPEQLRALVGEMFSSPRPEQP